MKSATYTAVSSYSKPRRHTEFRDHDLTRASSSSSQADRTRFEGHETHTGTDREIRRRNKMVWA